MKMTEYHERFAAKVIAQIEAGTAPWMKPWTPGESSRPMNATTRKAYRGGNSLFLSMGGYPDPRWATFNQVKAAGGHVTKGESGSPILFFGWSSRAARNGDGKVIKDGEGRTVYGTPDKDAPPVCKVYYVFNVRQTEGLEDKIVPLATPGARTWTDDGTADAIVAAAGVPVTHVSGDRAYYSPQRDEIVLPERAQFSKALDYYQTALHELIHATGHASRLDRETLTKSGGLGTERYAQEELRAEIGAMMLGELAGIGSKPAHGAAYIENWLKALRQDPREVYRAAADAQKAADWIMHKHAAVDATAQDEAEDVAAVA